MALMTRDSGGSGNFEPVPMGTHVSRCITVVDIGIQQTPWGGKEKVYLGFEVPAIRVQWTDKDKVEHEGPAIIGSRYTNSINEKAILGQHLVSWRGMAFTEEELDGFDLFAVLGAPCMLSVTHKVKGDKVYANIASIMRLPQGMIAPAPESELLAYSPGDPAMIGNLPKLPEWLQKLCKEGYEPVPYHPATDPVGGMAAPQAPAGPGHTAMVPPVESQLQPQDDNYEDEFGDSIPF